MGIDKITELLAKRDVLVKRLDKALEGLSPERRLAIVTSWMPLKDLEVLVKIQEIKIKKG